MAMLSILIVLITVVMLMAVHPYIMVGEYIYGRGVLEV
jgi:hypothetical protein